MRRHRPLALLVITLFGLLCALMAQANANSDALRIFFQNAYEEKLKDDPESATANGRHDYDNRWNDWSPSGRAEHAAHQTAQLSELAKISLDGVSDQDRLSARLFKYLTEQDLAAAELEAHVVRVSQLYGLHNRVYMTVDRMPVRTVKDYENIIARLHSIPAYVNQNITLLQEAMDSGFAQPSVIVNRVVDQLNNQLQQTSEDTALIAGFRKFPTNISVQEQDRLRRAAVTAYNSEFLPSWKKLRDFIDGPYRSRARSSVGISSVKGGREAYAVLVRRLTTTNRTPEQIHAIGLSEVSRIEEAMQQAARDAGFSGPLSEFSTQLLASPEQHFLTKDDMLAFCRNAAKIIEPELPGLFKHMPILIYGIRPIPEDREQATASNAQAPTPDGSTPGWFNLNTYEPTQQVKYDKEALVLHEAVPGHVFQIATARAIGDVPEFRKYSGNSAYLEGWALYAESLGSQLGVYRDPYSRYGQLVSERFRAVRLVVDTGMHALGWSREQAVAYFKEHAPEESLAEIDRYISWPGQALAYKLGQLEIMRLRHEAESTLGAAFDVRDFHDAVLRDGVLPLEILHEQVERYIHSAPN